MQTYSATVVPACGTSLFMEVQTAQQDSDAEVAEFLNGARENRRDGLSL